MTNKPTLYMYVGLPGSSKSTHAQLLAEEIGAKIMSSDALRAEWYGSEEIQGNPTKIFAEIERRCFTELSEGRSVIMDATNMNAGKRTKFLEKMPKGINSVCCVMATPFADCVARDKERSRSVGEEVIAKMRRNFQMPNYNEGWTKIWVQYSNLEYTDDEKRYDEEKVFDQQNHHHTLTLGEHEDKALEIAMREGYHDWVWIATQYHDCGKLFCQTFNDKGSDAHYYGHEYVSAYEYLTMAKTKADWDFGGERERVINIASLITWHMIPYQFHGFSSVKEQEDKVTEWCLDHGFPSVFAECLWQLHVCDLLAH